MQPTFALATHEGCLTSHYDNLEMELLRHLASLSKKHVTRLCVNLTPKAADAASQMQIFRLESGLNSRRYTIEVADQQDLAIDSNSLIKLATAIFEDHSYAEVELSIALVDDVTIRALNLQYLNHDWETDVISFVLETGLLDESDPDSAATLSGQLIISTETAARVAEEIESTTASEMALYVAHGTLHLVGYDDQDPASVSEMRAAEREYLDRFSIPCRDVEV